MLRAHGVRKGDRVFIQVGRIPEWWQTMLACLKIGAIAMPGTAMLTPKDIAYRISLSEPIAVVTESAYASRFDEVREKALSVRAYLAIGDARERWIDFRAERDRAPATAPTESTLASDYALVDGRSERLLDLCKQAGAATYLSGPAARAYLDEKIFEDAGIQSRFLTTDEASALYAQGERAAE